MRTLRLDDTDASVFKEDVRRYLLDKPIQGFEEMSAVLWSMADEIEKQENRPRPWWQRIFG